MKERPILFSAPMVRAILEDRKSMTRRVVKATTQDFLRIDPLPPACWIDGRPFYGWDGNVGHPLFCPYGQPGDRLWVRETWSEVHPVQIPPDRYSQNGRAGIPGPPSVNYRTVYRADGDVMPCWRRDDGQPPYFTNRRSEACPASMKFESEKYGWTPSIHMPRWASRILLEITGVRVERVQSISQMDALAEGIDTEGADYIEGENLNSAGSPISPERFAFARLWDSINAKRGFGWDANPWTWVIEFKRVTA